MEAGPMRASMNGMVIVGALLALLGIAGLAIPEFSTAQTRDVAKVGDLKLQATEHHSYFVPPALSGGALVVGILLAGAGMMQRR
jgi:hypothetical protein